MDPEEEKQQPGWGQKAWKGTKKVVGSLIKKIPLSVKLWIIIGISCFFVALLVVGLLKAIPYIIRDLLRGGNSSSSEVSDETISSLTLDGIVYIDENGKYQYKVKNLPKEILKKFIDAGYNSFVSLDSNGRGILCEVKGEYSVEKISEFSDPHMLHLRIKKDNESIELITVRLLVAGGNIEDFKDRRRQWNKVLNYIETIEDKEHLVITGDFNHGVISEDVRCYRFKPREHFNYQMVLSDLKRKGIELFHMEGTSYRGYMKIDHIATGDKIKVTTATYEDVFGITDQIGIPDHSCIVASVKCA